MLKEVVASNAAKLVAAFVCPVMGATVVALKVPQVRAAVHKATAPKATAQKAKPRRRKGAATPPRQTRIRDEPLQIAASCPLPVMLETPSLAPPLIAAASLPPPVIDAPPPRVERVYWTAPCAAVPGFGGHTATQLAGVPEPATWAQMIAGFALVGAVSRRHKRVTRTS